jgi:hypothetical protein
VEENGLVEINTAPTSVRDNVDRTEREPRNPVDRQPEEVPQEDLQQRMVHTNNEECPELEDQGDEDSNDEADDGLSCRTQRRRRRRRRRKRTRSTAK